MPDQSSRTNQLFAEYAVLAGIMAAYAVFCQLAFWPGDRHEFASLTFAGLTWHNYFANLQGEANGFGYYTCLGLFNDLLGWSRAGSENFSMLGSLGAAFFLYKAVRSRFSAMAALFAAALFLCSGTVIFFGSYARFYSWNMCWVCLSAWMASLLTMESADASDKGRPSGRIAAWAVFALSQAACAATMILSAGLYPAWAAVIIAAGPREVKRWAVTAGIGLLLAFFVWMMSAADPGAYALQGLNMKADFNLLVDVFSTYLSIGHAPDSLPLIIGSWETRFDLALIPAVISLILLGSGLDACLRRKAWFWPVWILSYAMFWVYSLIFKPVISEWNMSFLVPALYGIMGIGLAALPKTPCRLLLLVWALVCQPALVNGIWHTDSEFALASRILSLCPASASSGLETTPAGQDREEKNRQGEEHSGIKNAAHDKKLAAALNAQSARNFTPGTSAFESENASGAAADTVPAVCRAPLLIADRQVLERAESSMEPFFERPAYLWDGRTRSVYSLRRFAGENAFWHSKNLYNNSIGRPREDGSELQHTPWYLFAGIDPKDWPALNSHEADSDGLERFLSGIPSQGADVLKQLTGRGSCRSLWVLYTSPWCSSETEIFEIDKFAALLGNVKKYAVWDCGNAQLALLTFGGN